MSSWSFTHTEERFVKREHGWSAGKPRIFDLAGPCRFDATVGLFEADWQTSFATLVVDTERNPEDRLMRLLSNTKCC